MAKRSLHSRCPSYIDTDTRCVGCWVDPVSGLDALKKEEYRASAMNSNPDVSIVHTVAK